MVLMKKKKSMELEEAIERGQGLRTFSLTQPHRHYLKLMKKHMRGKRITLIIQDTKDRQLITLKIKYNPTN